MLPMLSIHLPTGSFFLSTCLISPSPSWVVRPSARPSILPSFAPTPVWPSQRPAGPNPVWLLLWTCPTPILCGLHCDPPHPSPDWTAADSEDRPQCQLVGMLSWVCVAWQTWHGFYIHGSYLASWFCCVSGSGVLHTLCCAEWVVPDPKRSFRTFLNRGGRSSFTSTPAWARGFIVPA